ncbi:hypothetical protein VNO80_20752 [Phaseolus coccineus]|uniref:Uncharacterized protein n=1 Tax=Phaseolus coccineus TaxID=3886 RepID=A0AAN9M6M4_PHACN
MDCGASEQIINQEYMSRKWNASSVIRKMNYHFSQFEKDEVLMVVSSHPTPSTLLLSVHTFFLNLSLCVCEVPQKM